MITPMTSAPGALHQAVLKTVNILCGGVYATEEDESPLDSVSREFHRLISRTVDPSVFEDGYVTFTQPSEDGMFMKFGVTNSDPKTDESYVVVTLPVAVVNNWIYPYFKLAPWGRAVLDLYPGFTEDAMKGVDLWNGYDDARELFIKVLAEKSGCIEEHLSQHYGSGFKDGIGAMYVCYPMNKTVQVSNDELMYWYQARQDHHAHLASVTNPATM